MESKAVPHKDDKDKLIKYFSVEIDNMLRWLASFGAEPDGGVTRLLYSEAWKKAQQALYGKMKQFGLTPEFDDVGNLFGRLQGTEVRPKAILTGSHIDTVKNGGRYDGAFGIVAAIIALRYLKDKYGVPKRTLEAVSLCEEEGSRFPVTYWGSGSMTGHHDFGKITSLKDDQGIYFQKAMATAGFGPHTHRSSRRSDIGAFIELHVEQGMVLERTGGTIGIVNAIVGQKRFTFEVTGQANHAGTTPMPWRKDAMNGASAMIQFLYETAGMRGEPLVATVGKLEAEPNIANVIPGRVTFTADIRHPDQAALDDFCRVVSIRFREIAQERGLELQTSMWMDEQPVCMHKGLSERIRSVSEACGIPCVQMVSGAGHDAQMFQPCFPTALIFVPSRLGISHSPDEYTAPEDLAAGTVVLTKMLYLLGYQEEDV
ncbi:allantoate deiminase [Paenibacillus tarimensis]